MKDANKHLHEDCAPYHERSANQPFEASPFRQPGIFQGPTGIRTSVLKFEDASFALNYMKVTSEDSETDDLRFLHKSCPPVLKLKEKDTTAVPYDTR